MYARPTPASGQPDPILSGHKAAWTTSADDIPGDIRSVLIATDRLIVLVAPDHAWADRTTPLTLSELAATPLVEREQGSGTRAFLDAAIATGRARPVAELNSNAAICSSVIAGLGAAVLSNLAARSAIRAGRLLQVPVAETEFERELRCIWFGGRRPVGTAGDFLDIALRTALEP